MKVAGGVPAAVRQWRPHPLSPASAERYVIVVIREGAEAKNET